MQLTQLGAPCAFVVRGFCGQAIPAQPGTWKAKLQPLCSLLLAFSPHIPFCLNCLVLRYHLILSFSLPCPSASRPTGWWLGLKDTFSPGKPGKRVQNVPLSRLALTQPAKQALFTPPLHR